MTGIILAMCVSAGAIGAHPEHIAVQHEGQALTCWDRENGSRVAYTERPLSAVLYLAAPNAPTGVIVEILTDGA